MHSSHNAPPSAQRNLLLAIALATLVTTPLVNLAAQTSTPTLTRLLQNPPDSARPMVRWWWFGPAVEKPEILRELQQMKADGIGGVELAFVYPQVVDDATHTNLPFLSPEMLEAVTYANTEARRLGLRVDVTLCSGWPYGGPHIPLSQAATRLRIAEVPVPANTGAIAPPNLAEGETILSAALVTGNPTPPPIRRAPAPAITWNPASAQPLTLPTPPTIPPSPTPRVALFFIQSHTLQQVKRAAVGAEGYVLDPFSREAVANHLKSVGEPLLKAFGPTPPYAIFSDSLEAYGADWTPLLPQEFQKRRGYDLLPHLPELVAGGTPAAERVRHDYGLTLTELVNENYLTQINVWAKAHHTRFRSQTYGEPAVSFSSQNLAALPEGEGPQWRAFSTLRWATSANHVFGNNVTSGETFTWLHSPVFRATPLDMKAEADIDFIMGENQLIFHGWPYSPPASELPKGYPGWSLYAAAALNDHNPWHPVMPAVTRYITRLSALLRQGQPANQVAILLPTDDAWAGFSPGKVTVTGAMQKLLPPDLLRVILSDGYNFDFIDAEAIEQVGLGSHEILVIPPTERLPPQTLAKIRAWASRGGRVIAVDRTPSIDPYGRHLELLPPSCGGRFDPRSPLCHQLFDPNDIPSFSGALLSAATPDLQITSQKSVSGDMVGSIDYRGALGFIRRRLPHADIYFVTNTTNQKIDPVASFATTHRFALQVDPDSLVASPAKSSGQSLILAPYESRIFLFSDTPSPGLNLPRTASATNKTGPGAPLPQLLDLNDAWTVSGKPATVVVPNDWSADPATLHFSGEVVYARDFNLPYQGSATVRLEVAGGKALPGDPATTAPDHVLMPNGLPNPLVTRTGPGMHAFYDPPIREAALVTLNGQPAGALWHPPYSLDVTRLLKPGRNHIEIHVFNTALNAWSANPPRDSKPLIAKYGDRFQMQDLNQVQPLPSGILGTIRLVTQPTP